MLCRHGFRWQKRPVMRGLTTAELEKRKAFVAEFCGNTLGWWQDNMQLILDGVTLTKVPKPLTERQHHMAQGIKAMWRLPGEQYDNAMHNYNRYGIQLGQKVPFWGGFTGDGTFTLRERTPRPNMTKQDWEQHLPARRPRRGHSRPRQPLQLAPRRQDGGVSTPHGRPLTLSTLGRGSGGGSRRWRCCRRCASAWAGW